jgi:hypothetical protein
MYDYSYLGIGNPNGIAATANAGNIQLATRNYKYNGNYIFNGITPQITGNGLQLAIDNLPTSLTFGINTTTILL